MARLTQLTDTAGWDNGGNNRKQATFTLTASTVSILIIICYWRNNSDVGDATGAWTFDPGGSNETAMTQVSFRNRDDNTSSGTWLYSVGFLASVPATGAQLIRFDPPNTSSGTGYGGTMGLIPFDAEIELNGDTDADEDNSVGDGTITAPYSGTPDYLIGLAAHADNNAANFNETDQSNIEISIGSPDNADVCLGEHDSPGANESLDYNNLDSGWAVAVAASDVAAGGSTYNETLTTQDVDVDITPTNVLTALASMSEDVDMSESVSAILSAVAALTDDVVLQESIAAGLSLASAYTQGLQAGDSYEAGLRLEAEYTQDAALNHTFTAEQLLAAAYSDSSQFGHTFAAQLDAVAAVSLLTTLGDTFTVEAVIRAALTNSVNFTTVFNGISGGSESVSFDVGNQITVTETAILVAALAEAITATDAYTNTQRQGAAIVFNLAANFSTSATLLINAAITENAELQISLLGVNDGFNGDVSFDTSHVLATSNVATLVAAYTDGLNASDAYAATMAVNALVSNNFAITDVWQGNTGESGAVSFDVNAQESVSASLVAVASYIQPVVLQAIQEATNNIYEGQVSENAEISESYTTVAQLGNAVVLSTDVTYTPNGLVAGVSLTLASGRIINISAQQRVIDVASQSRLINTSEN